MQRHHPFLSSEQQFCHGYWYATVAAIRVGALSSPSTSNSMYNSSNTMIADTSQNHERPFTSMHDDKLQRFRPQTTARHMPSSSSHCDNSTTAPPTPMNSYSHTLLPQQQQQGAGILMCDDAAREEAAVNVALELGGRIAVFMQTNAVRLLRELMSAVTVEVCT